MATRNQLLNGADFEGFEGACETIWNAYKNHFAQSDPRTNMTNPVVGIIVHDTDDHKFYGYTGRSGDPFIEFLQKRGIYLANLGGAALSAATLTSLIGPPADYDGYPKYVLDTFSGGLLYHVTSDGTNWWYVAMTMAV